METPIERVRRLCKERSVPVASLEKSLGYSNGYFNPKKATTIPWERAVEIGAFLGVSPTFILTGESDPIDYESDGDAIAEIPLAYVEAANGDLRKARMIMIAAEQDARREATSLKRFTPEDAALAFALWGDTTDIDDQDIEDVRRFAAFIREKKKKQ